MQPYVKVSGLVAPLDRPNVDTDQIIPKQFLKRIERTGFGPFAFFDWRFLPDGSPNPEFELNQPQYAGAQILVAGRNFGSGSSREHAPWALMEYGYRTIIASSFADIFYNNCFQNSMLPIVLPEAQVAKLMEYAKKVRGYKLTVDLEQQRLWAADESFNASFDVDPFRRYCLLNGLGDIGLTLQNVDKIKAYEQQNYPRAKVNV